MNVIINGQPRLMADGSSLADAIALAVSPDPGPTGIASAGIAVAVNGEVVTRARWPSVLIGTGDEVEIVTAVQGG